MITKMLERIPKEIRVAVEGLLKPFGMSLEMLCRDEEHNDEENGRLLLTKNEAADKAAVSLDTINRLIKAGCFKIRKLTPGRNGAVRIVYKSFIEWLNNGPDEKEE
ncbi:MAG: hypothetical protein VB042_09905 [Victivallaceae bacterium]|nr:hypothetical protein [Victivallaceae bacterium]